MEFQHLPGHIEKISLSPIRIGLVLYLVGKLLLVGLECIRHMYPNIQFYYNHVEWPIQVYLYPHHYF